MLTVSVTVAPSGRTAPDATLISPDCVEVNSPGLVVAAMKQLLMLDCPAKGTFAAKSPAGVFAGIVEDFSTSITRMVPLARTAQAMEAAGPVPAAFLAATVKDEDA